ncbi:LacI family transcriptional regulator [Alicyclobacillus fastidiosus]|uniref:LacI family transcriptional regulator n=1 Tax=Alicyclobacillus fastidiosus TaxID=392011 RepID=A0ABY6ZAJ9_9BACL|nr:LacI family DNA-binding transcriptional regulator [Alicyclobacillus fastidiosus]WAH39778.1 LacI family transcriptional regulator [Alicyclobacillus fastidiosus]GMA61026.1 LacI family transcriptional regulator [Alicyclobacillus fastidiosus]
MTNIHDVAKLAQVSSMTVSRVINGNGYVKEQTKKRVLQAMKELNYVPNSLARSLVRQKTQTLALIVPDIRNPFFTTIARGTEDMARKQNYRVILGNTDENVNKELEYIEMCLSIRVDGVIVVPAGNESKRNLKMLSEFKIPYVLVDREVAGIHSDVVRGDSVLGTKQLMDHLFNLGHQNIAIITGSLTTSTSRDRLLGYTQALKESGIEFRAEYVKEASYTKPLNNQVVHELVSCTPRPTAIFTANNFVAAQTVKLLRQQNFSVPEDVSIVSFDDFDQISLAEPFLTVATQPAYNFGSLATQMLFEVIDGIPISGPRKIIFQPEIIIRRSSGAARPISTP